MKKIVLLLLCLAFSGANAQKITKKFLVGKWTSESTEIVFSIENKKEFKIFSFSILTGNNLKVMGYQFNKGNFYLKTLHESNNWEALAKFIMIDENTLVADFVSNSPGQVIYKRVLNNDEEQDFQH
jgi:hypothetical protein